MKILSPIFNLNLRCFIILLISFFGLLNQVQAQCDYPPGDITLNTAGGNTNSFYTTQYVLVDIQGNIVQFQSSATFTAVPQGEYSAYAIDYKTADGITGLTIGQAFSNLTSDCLDVSPAFNFSVGSADATLAISDATICNPASGAVNITITNAQNGFTYELQTTAGASLSPAVTGLGTGADLTLTIPPASAPTTTTTYKVVASISGCSDTDLTDQPVVTVEGPLAITTQAANASICDLENTSFSIVANGGVGTLSYQWQESTDGGTTFTNISDGGIYAGAITATLSLTAATDAMDGNQYQVLVNTGACSTITSNPATLNVSSLPTATAGNATNVCDDFGAFDLSTLTTLPTASFGTIQWSADNGNAIAADEGTLSNGTTITPTYTPSVADIAVGTVSLIMTVTGTNGVCTGEIATATMLLTIDICCNASAPTLSGN